MADVREAELLDRLGLEPRPEGGWGVRAFTFRHGMDRVGESGYAMVDGEHPLSLHRVAGDTQWTFLEGDPCTLLVLYPDGRHEERALGPAGFGSRPLAIVPAACWQAVRTGRWALLAYVRIPTGAVTRYDGSWEGDPVDLSRYAGEAVE